MTQASRIEELREELRRLREAWAKCKCDLVFEKEDRRLVTELRRLDPTCRMQPLFGKPIDVKTVA